MAYYDSITVPQPFEAVEAAQSRLQAVSGVTDGLESSSHIYAHRQPRSHAARYVVVREMQQVGGYAVSHSNIQRVVIQVMTECRDDAGIDVDTWHGEMHKQIDAALVGHEVSLSRGTPLLPIRRRSRPGPVQYDADTETFYATAEYEISLHTV